jgi:hypothetical protein
LTYTANDLMEMAGRSHAWIDKRIEALDGQLSASEPEEAMSRRDEAEGGHHPGTPMHLGARDLVSETIGDRMILAVELKMPGSWSWN